MRKYVIGFLVAVSLVGLWEGFRYVQALRTEAATAHVQAQQGAQAFAYLATVLARDDKGNPTLTMGDALAQIVQAQLKAAQDGPK
jgi:hypothetical protein